MPIDLPQAHHNFYGKHHYLELESFFPEEKIEAWRKSLGNYASFDDAYLSGRDLWRKNPSIKKLITNRNLVQCASKLAEAPSLQLGFDQALCTVENTSKLPLAKQPVSLSQISNASSIACGAIINLSTENSPYPLEPTPAPTEELILPIIPLPHTPGSVLFISPELPLDFQKLVETPSQTLLLVVYTHVKPLYIQNALDPHANALKKLGYGFGDHLTTKTHPLLIK
ncbi:MAG: hypothetical protein H7A40_00155 [Chlamydiales bacterium]|nr:hypothetical protein [Chlamydiales bacterium]